MTLKVVSNSLYQSNKSEIVHTVMVPMKGKTNYIFDLPLPTAQSYIWLGFVRQENMNVDFSIIDRNTNLELYNTKDKAEYLAKLYFYQKERLEFIFFNPSDQKVISFVFWDNCLGS
jgi:hypothetical protein